MVNLVIEEIALGYVIKDLISHFYPNSKPKKFVEVFSGGGTGKDVAIELGITNSIHLDLINGWDALTDEIPTGADFVFSHQPYWDIIKYQYQRNSYHQNDLSNKMSYEEFINKLNMVNEKIYVDDELSYEFVPSGHLLGSCQIILYITMDGLTKSILYTGDIGNHKIHNHFVGEFQPVEKCTVAIVESTYGDRPDLKTTAKERKNDLNKLKTIIDTQIKEMKGKVLIPSFAQSRVQQLALMIYELYKDEEWQPKVYIDSPLAISIFEDYKEILTGEEKELFDELLNWENLIFVKESEDSKNLVASKEPCCIISTAGMCQVGRVRHHLKSLVSNPNATILFVGYSSEGSLASLLKDNKRKTVTIDFKEYECRCASYSLKSMSGHAPFDQLLDYYSSIHCNKIILHHGSNAAKENLAKALKEKLEKNCNTARVVISNPSLKFKI